MFWKIRQNCVNNVTHLSPHQSRVAKFHHIQLFLLTLSCCICTAPSALAQLTPDNTLGAESSSVNPNATLNGLPTQLIEGGAARGSSLFHSFSDFNVGNLQRVYFSNPTGIANILTRVTGSNPSNILGTLGVNGVANLFLINPNGILFGENAQLDISGSFLATTSDSLLLDGYEFSTTNPTSPPLLTLNVTPGLQYGANDPSRQIENAGNLSVRTGQKLTLFGGTVNQTGTLNAPGGTIEVLGTYVNLLEQANINVSSENGGGIVLIGGDYQGNGIVPNATETFVGENVVINADALRDGNGGRVIVWADKTTQFYGTINARGGLNSGDGGFVEVSGLQSLSFEGDVNTLAPNGTIGTLLLDPTNITVQNGVGSFTNLNQVNSATDPDIPPNTIDVALINAATANVILQATNDINFNATVNIVNPGIGLTAEAGNNINLNANINTNGGNVSLIADTDNNGNGSVVGQSIVTRGGNISIRGNQIQAGSVSSNTTIDGRNGGNVTLDAAGNITVTQIVTVWQGARMGNAGDVNVNAGGNFVIDGGDIATFTQDGNGGDIFINAGGNFFVDDVQSIGTVSSGDITITSGGEINTAIFGGTPGNIMACSGSQNTCAGGRGSGGKITLEATNRINIGDGLVATGVLGDGDISLTSSEIDLGRSVRGGILRLQPIARDRDIIIGGVTNNTDALELTARDLATLRNGLSSIIIGRADGSGTITLAGDVIFQDPITLLSPTGLGSINTTGFTLTGIDDASINLQANQINTGNLFTDGREITLTSQEGFVTIANALIRSRTNGSNSGDIRIFAPSVDFANTNIETSVAGAGSSGNITIDSPGRVSFNRSRINTRTDPNSSARGGNLFINAEEVEVLNSSSLSAITQGSGDSGDIRVNTRRLRVQNQPGFNLEAGISTLSFPNASGNGGDVTINASESVQLIGNQPGAFTPALNLGIIPSVLDLVTGVGTSTEGRGAAGNLTINTGQLVIRDGAGAGTGSNVTSTGNGGKVTVNATTVDLQGRALLVTSTAGDEGSALTINANRVNLTDGATISVDGLLARDAGDLTINTAQLSIRNGSRLGAATAGDGLGGTVNINASEFLEVVGTSADGTVPSGIFANSSGTGNAGDLQLTTPQLSIRDGGEVTTSTSDTGQGGTITVRASDVEIAGTSASGQPSRLTAFTNGAGNGGDLNILTRQLTVRGGGEVSANTTSTGQAGTLEVNASNFVEVLGTSPDGSLPSRLFFDSTSSGDAGELRINTPRLRVSDGGQVSAATSGSGRGGVLAVNAPNSVEVSNGGGLFFDSRGTGNARGIQIQTGDLRVENGGQITVSGSGTGISGDLEIAANSIYLNNQGLLRATTAASQGGNIRLQVANSILMRFNSEISAEAFGLANGGNITMDVGGLVLAILSENSDVVASAVGGQGGEIFATAKGIFGFRQFRGQRTPESDFTASSALGIDGIVEVNTEEQPSFPLPQNVLSPRLIQGCQATGGQTNVSLIDMGRGGIPETPYDPLTSDDVWEDVQLPKSWSENSSEPLVEAQGWVVNEKGNVVLVAQIPASRVGCGQQLQETVR
ncbi:filamentous hemagglutinin N-terminal domain-containing protein [Lusitaniella coriacea LEGE 07157]|uniref:Filamentous hemagglutinin N-terminal domain-containing protein n=1 Tax=Lusitaniella coriacea LEGE 07157 TaxID=945747 RepID=A0A8J7DWP9_9CYAN|nr:filamentous hemagglutinin N-terminal domain-containing protein [Lusitaniella coriacea]MBE9116617.1 filamentous hemagglutinin N-terminal domain-containing protein [Lusitaniella coriacea LEGE 07157]